MVSSVVCSAGLGSGGSACRRGRAGKSRIGGAISDEEHGMVFGRGFVDCKKGLKSFFEQISAWCKEDKVTTIVIGLPLGEDAQETVQTRNVRNFGKKLERFLTAAKIHVSVVFEDESFTSFEADARLSELNIKSKERKQHQDELAAVLILKRYLKRKNLEP